MQEISPLLGLGVVAFVSTNVDDLLVLVGFLADPKVKVGEVIAGQYLGIGALYLISLAGSLVSLVLAPQYVGFLGLAPVLIGAKKLYDLIRGHVGTDTSGTVLAPLPGFRLSQSSRSRMEAIILAPTPRFLPLIPCLKYRSSDSSSF